MNLEEMYKLREKMENKELNKESEEKVRRDMVIRVFKKYNDREPTEEEIQEDINYILKIKQKLSEKEPIPIIGPYVDKVEVKDEFIKVWFREAIKK